MQVKVLKALWGMPEEQSLESKMRQIHEAGYDGLECEIPSVEVSEWRELCEKYKLDFIGMIFAEDSKEFAQQFDAIQAYGPLLVNAHSGLDRMSFDEGCSFLREAIRVEAGAEVSIAHETHRHRIFYAPWSTAQYLREFPELRICADFSHWCVVCESLLVDMQDFLELAISRTTHIHGRVGYEEGPQVPDPRAPEYQQHVARHAEWWDAIRASRAASGAELLTFTPEFGPPTYLHTLPYTNQPVADLWDVCLWGAGYIRDRWDV